MKQTNNFAEIAMVFEAIAKVEVLVKKYDEAEKNYLSANEAACGKSIYGEEVREQMRAFEIREKIEKAYKRAAKKVVEVMGLSGDCYEERSTVEASKWAYRSKNFLYDVKYKAMQMTKGVDIYAE